MGDCLQTLPTDQQPIDPLEQRLLNTIFKEESTSMTRLFQDLKIPLIAGMLFVLLSVPQLNQFLKSTIPYARSSETSLIVLKAVVFIGIMFLIKLQL